MIHVLKLNDLYAIPVLNGIKNFELRKNDRAYSVGDYIEFKVVNNGVEIKNNPLKGKLYEITYVLQDETYLQPGYCALGIKEHIKDKKNTKTLMSLPVHLDHGEYTLKELSKIIEEKKEEYKCNHTK